MALIHETTQERHLWSFLKLLVQDGRLNSTIHFDLMEQSREQSL